MRTMILLFICNKSFIFYHNSTQRAQISDKAAHYPYIAQFRDWESQHVNPDYPQKFNELFFISLQSYPENFIKLHS